MNNGREPFSDPTVRKAVRQAIDKEGYKELHNGFGTIIGGPVPPTDPWYEDLTDVVPYDPDAARAALEAAGYGDGLDVTLTWPNIYPIDERRVRRLAARRGGDQRRRSSRSSSRCGSSRCTRTRTTT